MCVSCLSQGEVVLAHAALATAVLKGPAHRFLADLGIAARPDPVARDVRTVAFLRNLDLDPVEVLGAGAVARADRWQPADQPVAPVSPILARASASPIGSQSLLHAP